MTFPPCSALILLRRRGNTALSRTRVDTFFGGCWMNDINSSEHNSSGRDSMKAKMSVKAFSREAMTLTLKRPIFTVLATPFKFTWDRLTKRHFGRKRRPIGDRFRKAPLQWQIKLANVRVSLWNLKARTVYPIHTDQSVIHNLSLSWLITRLKECGTRDEPRS